MSSFGRLRHYGDADAAAGFFLSINFADTEEKHEALSSLLQAFYKVGKDIGKMEERKEQAERNNASFP